MRGGRGMGSCTRVASSATRRHPMQGDSVTRHVPRSRRLLLSTFLGIVAGFVTIQKNYREPTPRDFERVCFAARSFFQGTNPYSHVGPGLAFNCPFPLLSPLPAGVIALPFAPFPISVATVLFSFLGGFAL